MDIFTRAKEILLNPKSEWETVKTESTSLQDLFTKYAIILAAIPAVAGFIGYSVFGMNMGIASFRMPIGTGFGHAVFSYILGLIGVYIIGYVIDFLAPTFGSTKDLVQSMKVSVYSATASWVGGIFKIIPALSILTLLAGLYGLYLLYLGLRTVKDVPQEKMIGYFISVIIITIVIYMIVGAITTSIFFGAHMMR